MMSEFKPVNSEDRLIYELMPILIGISPNEDLICYGSCFVAWPHMAITAKHVVEELLSPHTPDDAIICSVDAAIQLT